MTSQLSMRPFLNKPRPQTKPVIFSFIPHPFLIQPFLEFFLFHFCYYFPCFGLPCFSFNPELLQLTLRLISSFSLYLTIS